MAVCFVRCPKCLSVLAEFPDIPLFKCCGCDAILSAEVHSDRSFSDNGLAIYVKEVSTASDKPETLEQEKNFKELESSPNAMKTPAVVTDSNGANSKEKSGFAVYEENNINKGGFEQVKVKPSVQSGYSAHSLIPETNDSRNSSDIEKHDHALLSIKTYNLADSMKSGGGDVVMNNSFKAEEQPAAQNNSRKFSIKSFSRVKASEQYTLEEHSLISDSKDAENFVKFRCSEKDNPVKILEKVDELKIKLYRMFSKRSDGKESSDFSIKVTQFEGKDSSKENQFSLMPSSRQLKTSSRLLCQPAGICFHNGNCRCFQETQIRHCRPVSGGAPFVICYKCYKLLQLPTDFLVSTKRVHKLRCGSCSEVLIYSYRPRTRAALNQWG